MREFKSAQLKIDRANHHIDDFDMRRKSFLQISPCKLRPQYNPHAAHTEYVVENVTEIDPLISLVIGDAIHNLRSALDHLAAALVRDNGGIVTANTYFPISQSSGKHIAGAPGKIQGMSIPDQALIDLQKPYLTGNDAFWGLHRMDITDKHDLILTQTQCIEAINYRVSDAEIAETFGSEFFGDNPSTEKQSVSIPWVGPLLVPKNGDELLRFPGNTEKDENIQPSFDIAFGDVEVFKGKLVLQTLRDLSTLVQGTINQFV